jgi:hypothetical protein
MEGEDRMFGGDLDRLHAEARAISRCFAGGRIVSSVQST